MACQESRTGSSHSQRLDGSARGAFCAFRNCYFADGWRLPARSECQIALCSGLRLQTAAPRKSLSSARTSWSAETCENTIAYRRPSCCPAMDRDRSTALVCRFSRSIHSARGGSQCSIGLQASSRDCSRSWSSCSFCAMTGSNGASSEAPSCLEISRSPLAPTPT